jgi:antibiotic biosynthesis monooxygenase (ABM) superfamily enzyme
MGIVGPQIYNLKFGPTYRVSYTASVGLLAGTVVALLLTWWTVARSRKTVDEEAK